MSVQDLFVKKYFQLGFAVVVVAFLSGFAGFIVGAEVYRVYINLVVEQCASNSNIECNIPIIPW